MVEKARNSCLLPKRPGRQRVSAAGNARMPSIDLFEIILVIEGEFIAYFLQFKSEFVNKEFMV